MELVTDLEWQKEVFQQHLLLSDQVVFKLGGLRFFVFFGLLDPDVWDTVLLEDDFALELPILCTAGNAASLANWAQFVHFPITSTLRTDKVGLVGTSDIGTVWTTEETETTLNVVASLSFVLN